MTNHSFLNWLFCFLSFACVTLAADAARTLTPRDKFLVPPPEYLDRFTFGFSESIADSFWLRWIQDGDNCQTYLKPVEKIEVASVDEKNGKLTDYRRKVCDISWSYKMLDTISNLAPKFEMPYLAGAISLAVITEDYEGASRIFDKGIQEYPNDWTLLYRGAYHAMIDIKDNARAAELLERASRNGGPIWMRKLASRLYTESGAWELALRTLLAYRQSMTGTAGVVEVDAKIADLKEKIRRSPAGKSAQ